MRSGATASGAPALAPSGLSKGAKGAKGADVAGAVGTGPAGLRSRPITTVASRAITPTDTGIRVALSLAFQTCAAGGGGTAERSTSRAGIETLGEVILLEPGVGAFKKNLSTALAL